ncbi:MAG: hypothetical protein ABJC26_02945, partial [Gemmatimonadaceae bacterium]
MKLIKRLSVLVALAALASCAESTPPPPAAPVAAKSTVLTDLDKAVATVEKKMVDLAKVMPESSMDWRPMPGVRSVREVFLHIAGENYIIPSFFGTPIPASTGIDMKNEKSITAYEGRKISRDSTVADLETSFKALRAAMAADTV